MPTKKKKLVKKKVAKKAAKKKITSSQARVKPDACEEDYEFSQADAHSGGTAFMNEAKRAINGESLPGRVPAPKAKVGDLTIVNPTSKLVKEKLEILDSIADTQYEMVKAISEIEKEGKISLNGKYEVQGDLIMGKVDNFEPNTSTISLMGDQNQTVDTNNHPLNNVGMRDCVSHEPSKKDKMNLILDLLRSII